MASKVSKDELVDFLKTEFPQADCTIESIGEKSSVVKRSIGFSEQRPGNTVSGPVMFAVADFAIYVTILSEIGLVALAVTTNVSINFLRKPRGDRDLLGKCTLLKIGKSLIVGEVTLFSEGDENPVAHAIGTYSIPPLRL